MSLSSCETEKNYFKKTQLNTNKSLVIRERTFVIKNIKKLIVMHTKLVQYVYILMKTKTP